MSVETTPNQESVADRFEDFGQFKSHKKLKKNEIFDDQFLDFIRWVKADVKSNYSKADFHRIERRDVFILILGFPVVFGLYLLSRAYLPVHPLVWGIPLFFAAVWVYIRAEGVHMRAHSPVTLTGSKLFDGAIDYFGMMASGVSQSLFKRRHLAAHYNDVGTVSKLFSNVWITYDKVPILFYLRPWLLLKFLADKDFCKEEMVDRRKLAIETLFFYGYLGLLITELFYFDSYFLLCFHMLPGLWVAGAQIIGATFVHSGFSPINSFESNGIFDPAEAPKMLKVPLYWFGLFNAKFFQNHAVHHAWPQVPLAILNENHRRYNAYILSHYEGVRYNSVLAAHVHRDLLAKLPDPRFYDYIIAWGICLVAHVSMLLAALGLPIPPVLFEPAMVDYRIYTHCTREERIRAKVVHLEGCRIAERFAESEDPNVYLRYYNWLYHRLRVKLDAIEAKAGVVSLEGKGASS